MDPGATYIEHLLGKRVGELSANELRFLKGKLFACPQHSPEATLDHVFATITKPGKAEAHGS